MIKTTIDQLDQTIVDKLTRLDAMESNYKQENGSIVTFDGKNYGTTKLEFPKESTIYFTSNELCEMQSRLYSSSKGYKSTADSYMTMGKVFASNFKNLLTSVEPLKIFLNESDILISKICGNFYYFYTKDGNIYKIMKNNPSSVESINIIRPIKESFLMNFDSRDVVEFLPYKDGYLVSTLANGVFYVIDGIAELRFAANDIFRMFSLPNKNILCISRYEKPSIKFYDFVSGKLISTSNVLRVNDKQYPKDAMVLANGDIIVLGKPSGGNPSSHIVHHWKLDEGGIGYVYSPVGMNKASIFYEVKSLGSYKDRIFVSGVNKGKVFFWVYDAYDMREEPKEVIFDKLDVGFDDLGYCSMDDDGFTITVKNRMISFDMNGEVLENCMLKDMKETKATHDCDGIIIVSKNECVKYQRQKYVYMPDMNLEVYNANIPCNNLNVYMMSNDGCERAAFFDAETLEQIVPAYYGISIDHETMINIEDCKAKRIIMKIASPKGNEIKGVVVNKNQLYMKKRVK